MNLELRQIQWSQVANQRLLVQHEKAAMKTGLSLESTHIVVRLDLDDEEWEEFTTNLTGFRPWLEGQGGNGIQDEVEYRKAVKVSGPDRTIYIDPQGGAHARFVGFPQEEPCPVKTPTSPEKTSTAAATGGRAARRPTRNRKGSSARSAAKNGASSPTPAAPATRVAETPVIEPAAQAEASTVPAAPPAAKPARSSAPQKRMKNDADGSSASASAAAAVATANVEPTEPPAESEPDKAKSLTDLFELLDDNSTDEDW